MAVDAQDTLSGTTFAGKYRVERRLGMGGMGAVYLATQDPLGRQVALKVLRPSLLGDPVAVERFRNEARVVAQLGHPHVVGIHEFGTTDDGVMFIAMEYLPGNSLGATIRSEGALPWQRTVPIVRDIARALAAAHKRGVVHRDLKPDNIVLAAVEGMHDFVKVLDFGIAKLVAVEENAKNLTGTGFVPGTPGYIAPELIMGGHGADDARGDLYSLGITWFEMLTARRPYEGDSAMKVFLAQLNDSVPKVSERHPGVEVPAQLEVILRSLLAKDPDVRPRDAEALLAMLEVFARAHGIGVEAWPVTPSQGGVQPTDAQLATLTSLSTPGTSVRAVVDAPVAPPAPPPTASPPAAVSPSAGPPTSATGRSETVETLIADRAIWTRRWKVLSTASVVLGLLVLLLLAQRHLAESTRRGELPLHASTTSEAGESLVVAVDAFLHAERERSLEAVNRCLATEPKEPGCHALRALLVGEHAPEDRVRELTIAESELTIFDRWMPHHGAPIIKLLLDTYRVPADQLVSEWDACGDHCKKNPFALVAAGDVFCSENVNRVELGIGLLDAAIAMNPTLAAAHEAKADVYLRVGSYHEAVVAAEKGLVANPTSAALLQVAGRAHLASGELDEAIGFLRRAVENGAGAGARVALANAYILGGRANEPDRQLLIASLLLTATPADRCLVATKHGSALIGAGRGHAALELYKACVEKSRNVGDLAASTFMQASQAFEALDDPALWQEAAGLGAGLGGDTGFQHFLPTIFRIGDAIYAAQNATPEQAKAKLDALDALPDEVWPPRAKEGIIAHVKVRVYPRLKMFDEAMKAAKQLEKPCRIHLRQAIVEQAAGRLDDMKEDLDWLVRSQALCRQAEFQGAYVLEALVLRAELKASTPGGAADAAAELKTALESYFPLAEPEGMIMQRAQAVLTAPASSAPQ